MARIGWWGLFALVMLSVAPGAYAQTDLLINGGMEDPYINQGRADLNAPQGWRIWLAQGAEDQFFNRGDRVTAFPHNGPGPDPVAGARAHNFNGGFVQYTAALYQTVTTTPDTNLTASAYAQVKACNPGEGADNCGSAVESGAQARIGIDPSGGTDPNAPGIVWGGWIAPHDRWEQMTVSATATGGSVTVWLYTTQANVSNINRAYFDAAALTVGGAGGVVPGAPGEAAAPPPPPPPAFAPFVRPQDQRADGSIVHVVAPGDTFFSIAVAYGVTVDQLQALNPTLPSIRFLQVGQQIIIRAASGAAAVVTPTVLPLEGTPVAQLPDATAPADDAALTANPFTTSDLPLVFNAVRGLLRIASAIGNAPDEPVFSGWHTSPGASPVTARGPAGPAATTINTAPPAASDAAVSSVVLVANTRGRPQLQPPATVTRAAPLPTVTRAAPQATGLPGRTVAPTVTRAAPQASATPTPSATLTPTPPVASALDGTVLPPADITRLTTTVCALLFHDANQNRLRERGEAVLPAGELALLPGSGQATPRALQPGLSEDALCLDDLAPGRYTLVASAPPGWGLTAPPRLVLEAAPGDTVTVAFGVAQNVRTATVRTPSGGAGGVSRVAATSPTADPAVWRNWVASYGSYAALGAAGVFGLVGAVLALLSRRGS